MNLFLAMRTFVEVVQSGSMSAAARRLNVTSALVGQRISALEDHLQSRLLNRTTRQHTLTEFGAAYLDQCRDILELVARSEGAASDQKLRPQGLLRIAAPVSFGAEALMPALRSFSELAPEVEIDLVLSDANEDLIAGGIDLAFRIGRLEDSTLLQTRLAPYRMALCAAPDYLAAVSPPRDPADLKRFRAILFSRTGRRPWRFARGDQRREWQPEATITVNSGHAVRRAAEAGMGIAMLPEVLVQESLRSGALERLLPDWDLPDQPMSLLYHRDRYMPLRLSHFISFAKSTFGSAPPAASKDTASAS
ncbi:LysR family transcriptional regulator [Rhodobacteraceae bacterium DSL-40]|uniref:LysR family transcriptional regulator n=1 Tax=Amaricoccus sp. B4 TaxID=3368557 RepID=UPI000DACB55E